MASQNLSSNASAKLAQNRNVILLIAGLLVFLLLIGRYCFTKIRANQLANKALTPQTVKLSALSEDITDSSIALQRLEKKLEEYEQQLTQAKVQEGEGFHDSDSIVMLAEKIRVLEEKFQSFVPPSEAQEVESKNIAVKTPAREGQAFPSMPVFNEQADWQGTIAEPALPSGINIDKFKETTEKPKKAPNYIPAGTFVKALLIQGIDASASIASQSDPRPVLMRLVSPGSLPNEVRSHLEDCRLIGAAYGDVSSERAFIRLESLSCTLKSKDILENVVDGYVVGEDGKAGMRGVVVHREKDLLKNSFLSGLASGFGSGLSDSLNRDLVSPLGVVTQTNSSDVFKKGAAQGAGNAFDRLSKYYIERAEQFQPVIQVAAGREIDVVFKKGFYLQEGVQPLQLAQDEVSKK